MISLIIVRLLRIISIIMGGFHGAGPQNSSARFPLRAASPTLHRTFIRVAYPSRTSGPNIRVLSRPAGPAESRLSESSLSPSPLSFRVLSLSESSLFPSPCRVGGPAEPGGEGTARNVMMV